MGLMEIHLQPIPPNRLRSFQIYRHVTLQCIDWLHFPDPLAEE